MPCLRKMSSVAPTYSWCFGAQNRLDPTATSMTDKCTSCCLLMLPPHRVHLCAVVSLLATCPLSSSWVLTQPPCSAAPMTHQQQVPGYVVASLRPCTGSQLSSHTSPTPAARALPSAVAAAVAGAGAARREVQQQRAPTSAARSAPGWPWDACHPGSCTSSCSRSCPASSSSRRQLAQALTQVGPQAVSVCKAWGVRFSKRTHNGLDVFKHTTLTHRLACACC
jgi:hypothetical protein